MIRASRRLLALAAALTAVLAAGASPAPAVNCLSTSVKDKLAGAEVAFVGKVVAVTPVERRGGITLSDYRFDVLHGVKGIVGAQATLRAARLVDIDDQVVTAGSNVAIGVLATHANGRLVTSSCSLVDPGSLLGATDEPKGGGIKVVIGVVLLGIVLAYSLRRLRKRRQEPPLRSVD